MLDQAGIAVVDGSVFGSNGHGHLRISYTVSYEDCKEGMERLAQVMSKLVTGQTALAQ